MIARYDVRRFWTLCSVFGALLLLVVLRLAWLQIVRAEVWAERAENRSSRIVTQSAPRGRILDRNGLVLAVTEVHTDVGFAPSAPAADAVDVEALAAALHCDRVRLGERLRVATAFTVLAKNRVLAPAERDVLGRLPGVTLEDRVLRRHPHGTLALRLLGTVSRAGAGTYGLEIMLNDLLSGERGEELQRFDRSERLRATVPLHPPISGFDVYLTIDATIQGILEAELERARVDAGAHRAQGIVMDPRTGEVLALAQVPMNPTTNKEFAGADPHRVMGATDVFEPGSSFKLLTTASLLSRSVSDTATTYDGKRRDPDARRSQKVFEDNQVVHDTHPVGVVSLRRAFTVSSNIVYATAVGDLMKTEFHEDLRRFGIGRRPGSGLPEEENGILNPAASWSSYAHRTIAYGQGVGVTLLQMASAYSALVSDGYLRMPRLVRDWRTAGGRVVDTPRSSHRSERVIPPRIIPTLRDLCRAVVAEEGGTGRRARIEGLDIGGKTGTAQVPARSGGYLPGVYSPNFFGFVPAENPRLLVGIVMHRIEDRHASGGTIAAPVFQRVVRKIASSTRYLDAAAVAQTSVGPLEVLPDLIGRSAAAVQELAATSGWILRDMPKLPNSRAVGQIPQAGSRVSEGTRVRVTWAGVRP